ncbi:MAG: hypothetical protein NT170_02770 [Candidatus Moranbacteria bacterium]|nr:hypothetical protein [Candidatus Moranbacteria bacterium]
MRTRFGFVLTLLLIFLKISFCKADALSVAQNQVYKNTNKLINVLIYKKTASFRVENLDVILGNFHYLDNYSEWKNKFYNGCVLSFKNNPLGCFSVSNNLSITICSDYTDTDGNPKGDCVDQPEGELVIQLPYFPNGKYADIFDPSGKKVLTIDLSSKATCNENDQCDRPVEDGENCPQDCKKQEPKIDPVVMKQAETEQQATSNKDGKISLSDLGWWPLIIGLLLLFGGGGLGYYIYRRNREF